MNDYLAFRAALQGAYRAALSRAVPPHPLVAQHWEPPALLSWLALFPSGDTFHLAMSFGRLKGRPPPTGGARDVTGVFLLSSQVFPGVDEAALSRGLVALVSAGDGASRAFLQRVVAQLAVAEVALALEADRAALEVSSDFAVSVPKRADALGEPAPTPRLPGHAQERVLEALSHLGEPLSHRVKLVLEAPNATLLEAVRRGRRSAAEVFKT